MFFPISILVPINSFLPSIKKKTCSKFLNRLSQPKLLPSRWKVLISRGYFPLLFTASHGSLSSFHNHHHRLMVPAVFKFQLWLELEKRSSLMNAKISTLQKLSSHFRMLSSGIRFISKRKIPSVRIFGGKSTFPFSLWWKLARGKWSIFVKSSLFCFWVMNSGEWFFLTDFCWRKTLPPFKFFAKINITNSWGWWDWTDLVSLDRAGIFFLYLKVKSGMKTILFLSYCGRVGFWVVVMG